MNGSETHAFITKMAYNRYIILLLMTLQYYSVGHVDFYLIYDITVQFVAL